MISVKFEKFEQKIKATCFSFISFFLLYRGLICSAGYKSSCIPWEYNEKISAKSSNALQKNISTHAGSNQYGKLEYEIFIFYSRYLFFIISF